MTPTPAPDIITTTLYLLSALIQADATILGFGAIFVIYKLQALDTLLQQTLTLCEMTDKEGIASTLLVHTDKKALAMTLRLHKGTLLLPHLEKIVTIPKRQRQIKQLIKLPSGLLAFHASLSAILLWQTPSINWQLPFSLFYPYGAIILFVIALVLSVRVSWQLVSKEDELSLKRIDKELYDSAFTELPHDGPQQKDVRKRPFFRGRWNVRI